MTYLYNIKTNYINVDDDYDGGESYYTIFLKISLTSFTLGCT